MAIFDYNPSAITPFPYWRWNKVLPAVYDDSLSQYELLCKLLSVVNNIIESTNSTGEQVEALTQLVQQLIDGGFPSGLVEYVNQMVDAAMADDIAAINAIIDSMKQAMPTKYAKLNDSSTNLVCIGDSWNSGACDGQLSGYSVANGWARQLCTLVNRDISDNFSNYMQPSSGFAAQGGSQNRTFADLLQSAIDSTTEATRFNTSTIIVAGGINDSNALDGGTLTYSDIVSGATQFCTLAAANYPNAAIYVFPMLWPGHSTVRNSDVRTKNAIIAGCRAANAMVSICNHTPEFLFGQSAFFGSKSQGHHTTLGGLTRIAHMMAEFICGGDSRFTYWSNLRDTSVTNAITFNTLDVTVNDGLVNTRIYGTLNDNFDSTNVPLFSLRNGDTFYGSRIPTHVIAAIGGNQAPVLCRAFENEIYFSSRLASTPVSGNNIYIDFTIPFAF